MVENGLNKKRWQLLARFLQTPPTEQPADLHAAVGGLPPVQRPLKDPMAAALMFCLLGSLGFAQHHDDPPLSGPALLQVESSFSRI